MRRDWPSHTLTVAACLLLGAVLSLFFKQDINWDLKNYHLYNAWALLHQRQSLDLAAAGMQSFFNPLLDLPYYWLGTGPLRDAPRILAALQGLWFGALLYLLWGIVSDWQRVQGRPLGAAAVIAVLLGASGSMAVSQVGTTTNELPLAVLVLASLRCVLPLYDPQADRRRPLVRLFIAGALAGLAAGLKPTAIVYPPALALAVLVSRRSLREAVIYAIGAMLAFLCAYGWWGWHLYQLTGNPFFPLFNQVFQSDWVPASAGTDARFRPTTVLQWVAYPFYWILKNRMRVTELGFADARYALGMLAALALALKHPRATKASAPLRRLLLVFVASAYVCWLVLFSILRYAVPIEALTGLLLLAAAQAWLPDAAHASWLKRPQSIAMFALLLLVAATTSYPNLGHTSFRKQSFAIDLPQLVPGSLVLIVGAPQAYLAPFFKQANTLSFVGLTWFTRSARNNKLWAMTQQRIAEHRGDIYVVRRSDADEDIETLQQMLPKAKLIYCRAISSALESDRRGRDLSSGLEICQIER